MCNFKRRESNEIAIDGGEMPNHKFTLKQGFSISIVLTTALISFSIITAKIGLTSAFMGFLFFWYWSSIKEFSPEEIKEDVIGSLVGIGISYGVYTILHTFGKDIYGPTMIIVLFVVLFFNIMKIAPMIVNNTTFLFITVLTSNQLLVKANYIELLSAYSLGVVFFIVVVCLVFKFLKISPS